MRILLFLLLFIPLSVIADGHSDKTNTNYFTVGLGYMDTNLDLEDEPGYSGWSSDDDSGAFRLGYGYYFTDAFALEAHYQVISGSEIEDPAGSTAAYDIYTLSLEGVYEVPVAENIDIVPRIGMSYAYQELSTRYSGNTYSVSDDDYYLTYGVGVQFIDSWRFEFYKIGDWDNPSLYLISYKFSL